MATKIEIFSKLLIAVSFFLSHSINADFDLGMQYYAANDFEKAHKEFLQVAELGDAGAQFNLGVMYYRGEFFEKDLIKSYAWFALAAEKSTGERKSPHLGLYAKMSDQEKAAADAAYNDLSTEYSQEAITQRLLPNLMLAESMVKKMRAIKRVVPIYPKAVARSRNSNGIVDVLYTVDKNGITRDHVAYYASNEYMEKAAIVALRQWRYEPTIVHGKPVDVNGVKIRFVFQLDGTEYNQEKIEKLTAEMRAKAINGGGNDKLAFAFFIEAINAYTYTQNQTLTENPNTWYIEAANSGNAVASYFLGRNVLYGDMCSADATKSMSWLIKAAQQDISDAQYMLALESFSGVNFEKDEHKGFYWLKRAAPNSTAAKFRLAWILATHPDSARRDGKAAVDLIENIDKDYYDRQTYFQVKAAAAAETGDFKRALGWAKDAKNDAKKLQLPEQYIDAQIAHYEKKQAWRETL